MSIRVFNNDGTVNTSFQELRIEALKNLDDAIDELDSNVLPQLNPWERRYYKPGFSYDTAFIPTRIKQFLQFLAMEVAEYNYKNNIQKERAIRISLERIYDTRMSDVSFNEHTGDPVHANVLSSNWIRDSLWRLTQVNTYNIQFIEASAAYNIFKQRLIAGILENRNPRVQKDDLLATQLTEDPNHSIYVLKNNRGIIVITNKITDEMMNRILALIPVIQNKIKIDEKRMPVCEAFATDSNRADTLLADYFIKEKGANNLCINTALEILTKTATEGLQNHLMNELNRIESQIAGAEESLNTLHKQKEEKQVKLFMFSLGKFNKADTENLKQTLINNKDHILRVKSVYPDRMEIVLRHHLTNYDTSIAEQLITSEANNTIRQNELNAVFNEIFVEQTYRFICDTKITINFKDATVQGTIADYSSLPNPHLGYFSCFGEYKNQIRNAIRNGDYNEMLLYLFLSNQSFNFADIPVLDRLCDKLKLSLYNAPILQSEETGEVISLHQLQEKLEEEQNNETDQDDTLVEGNN